MSEGVGERARARPQEILRLGRQVLAGLGRRAGAASGLALRLPPPVRTLITAAGTLLAWVVTDCLDVLVAFSRQTLRMAADVYGFQVHWVALVPLSVGLATLTAAGLASARGRQPPPLRSTCLLTVGLLGLRILSLWDPAGSVFPFLSLLWAPHASWSLGLTWAAVWLHRAGCHRSAVVVSPGRFAWGLFGAVAIAYSVAGIYISQLTMPHGDEAHYMLVSQSLLRDGDIDLSNNLGDEDMLEFRVLPFEVHRAPSSPEGRIYSVHPPGLSVLMTPFYWIGLTLWHRPRLACVLLVTVLSAAWLALSFVWLVRLGFGRGLALLTVGAVGSAIPAALFSTQLYTETPALVAMVLVLIAMAHWQVGGAYRSLGRREPVWLGGLVLLLGTLAFLHARYVPPAGLLGLLLAAHAAASRRRANLVAVGAAAAIGAAALVAYNEGVSGDWLGHLRPGNAWDADALQPMTWRLSLPGHWLHETEGLLANSPIYALALVGLGSLAGRRDRRLVVALVLYAATAAVNGLHPDWRFGFGPPTRFLMSAMPALLLLLAAGLGTALRSPAGTFAASLLMCLSWESILAALPIPELAFEGQHLLLRSSARYYPLNAHFLPNDFTGVDFETGAFWLTLFAAAVTLGYALARRRRRLLAAVACAALAPMAWGRTEVSAGRLAVTASPFLTALSDTDLQLRGTPTVHYRDLAWYTSTTGQRAPEGRFEARAGTDGPGLLASVYLPLQQQGLYRLQDSGFGLASKAPPASASPVEYVLLTRRRTMPVVQAWEEREFLPLDPVADARGLTRDYVSDHTRLGYLLFPYSGTTDMDVDSVSIDYHPVTLRLESTVVARFPAAGGKLPFVATQTLTHGRYRVHFDLEGDALGTLTERHPAPVLTAVLSCDPGGEERLQQQTSAWLAEDRDLFLLVVTPTMVHPLVERLEAPWWVEVPFADGAYDLVFSVAGPQVARFLVRYDGPADLHLEEVVLYQQTLKP